MVVAQVDCIIEDVRIDYKDRCSFGCVIINLARIIDEFHYYNPKQLATFLFFIKLSQQRGYIDNTAENLRQFCILTATPRPAVKRYLDHLGLRIDWIEPNNPIPSEDQPHIEPIRALARLELKVYSTEELQMGERGEQAGGG